MPARAAVEALLRERKLDRTLTTSLPEHLGEDAVAAFGVDALDRALSGPEGRKSKAAGGLPRGHVSEVVGPSSSGRTSLAWTALAAATHRGESVALIDTFDRFDPPTAHACGIELSRMLWVRGQSACARKLSGELRRDRAEARGAFGASEGGAGTLLERVIDRAIKALNLVVQSGVCTLVVIDLVDVPAAALRRLPASTWFRIERAIEGRDTAVLILAAQPIARSSGGRSIVMGGEPGTGNQLGSRLPVPGSRRVWWKGDHERTRRIAGISARASIGAARWAHAARVDLQTAVINGI